MSEGELYKKIDEQRYVWTDVLGDKKKHPQDEISYQKTKKVLDEAKQSAPKEVIKKLDPSEWMKWFEEWFGEAEK